MSTPAARQEETGADNQGRTGIPVVWQVGSRGVFILGGGKAGCQKARALERFGVAIHLMEPVPGPEVLELARNNPRLTLYTSAWTGDFPAGTRPDLAYACTNQTPVNQDLGRVCRDQGIPFCNAESPEAGDFMSPACEIHEGFVLAVSSGGKKVKAAVEIRNRLKEAFRQAIRSPGD